MCGCWTRGWLPGQMVPLHTHRWASVLYIVSWSDFVRRDGDGVVVADSRGFAEGLLGRAVWSGALWPHTLENMGETELRVIAVEQKLC